MLMNNLLKLTIACGCSLTTLLCGCSVNTSTASNTTPAKDLPDSLVDNESATEQSDKSTYQINPKGTTIATRYTNLDPRYERRATDDYGNWLLNRSLHPIDYNTHYYNGVEKANKCQIGVLTYDLIGKDLQQCADACIRLRAEYLWEKKMYDKIHFKNTPGFDIRFRKWADGYRVHFDKNWKASGSKDAQPDYSYKNFRKYLSFVFTYCGTLSLSKELRKIKLSEVQPGDMLVYGNSPGHAVTIMDVLHEKSGKKIKLMFSQSYMPAQEIEILANRYDNNSPWFELEKVDDPDLPIDTPEWPFYGKHVMRWTDL